VFVHLSSCHLIASELTKSFGNLVHVHLLETLISPNTWGDELAHMTKNKTRHDTSPAHPTPTTLGRSTLHLLNLISQHNRILISQLLLTIDHCLGYKQIKQMYEKVTA